MNPSLRIKPYEAKCGQETEELFSDDFYSGLSVSSAAVRVVIVTLLGLDLIMVLQLYSRRLSSPHGSFTWPDPAWPGPQGLAQPVNIPAKIL